MRRVLLIFLVLPVFYDAVAQPSEQKEHPPIIGVFSGDKTMNRAIHDAQETLDHFHAVLTSGNEEQKKYISLKVRMQTTKGETEHIWLNNIHYGDSQYHGIIDNMPVSINNLKVGDKVKVFREDITDWFYIEDGKLYGGYTIRILRDRMSRKERKKFDAEFPVEY